MGIKLLGNDSTKIYDLLLGADKRKKKKLREELLSTVGVEEEYFDEGSINIDSRTCKGAECKLCIKACPTNALYWAEGMVKIEEDLCIYCAACIISCIVDNCIQITRKRKNGEVEKLGTPKDVVLAIDRRTVQRRGEALQNFLVSLSKTQNENTKTLPQKNSNRESS